MKRCLRCSEELHPIDVTPVLSPAREPIAVCLTCGEKYNPSIVESAPAELWDWLRLHGEVMLEDGSRLLIHLEGSPLTVQRVYPTGAESWPV